jgi:transposase-like protein
MPNLRIDKKERARHFFLTTSLTQAEIALQVNISQRTLSHWVREGNWRELKKSLFYSPQAEIQRLYEELRTISNNILAREPEHRVPTKEELDARIKIIRIINALRTVGGDWRNIPHDHGFSHPEDAQAALAQQFIFRDGYYTTDHNSSEAVEGLELTGNGSEPVQNSN